MDVGTGREYSTRIGKPWVPALQYFMGVFKPPVIPR